MNIIDSLLDYMECKDKNIIITTNIKISDSELNVVVIKILSWLKLEHKRKIWISEGKKSCFKPLDVDMRYPWCINLNELVQKESRFHDFFSIEEGKFNFSENISEQEREIAREKVFNNYNPQRHT